MWLYSNEYTCNDHTQYVQTHEYPRPAMGLDTILAYTLKLLTVHPWLEEHCNGYTQNNNVQPTIVGHKPMSINTPK